MVYQRVLIHPDGRSAHYLRPSGRTGRGLMTLCDCRVTPMVADVPWPASPTLRICHTCDTRAIAAAAAQELATRCPDPDGAQPTLFGRR